MECTPTSLALPSIIQGGMGIGVSNWKLAQRVAELGAFGVVSGTALDSVLVRELQDGDPHGRLAVLATYPDQDIVAYLKERFFMPEGKALATPYKLLPIHKFNPTLRSQRILSAASFSEVRLAKHGHQGLVGMNLLSKLKRYTLPCMYGAMLAGVDAFLMGAGIPIEEAEQIPLLAQGLSARLRLDVDTSQAPAPQDTRYYTLDPKELVAEPPVLDVPMFFPIISSDTLARILSKKLPRERITGWIIETPIAGGHNAPPRRKRYNEAGTPIYDERDLANLAIVAALGFPFYLAGGYGSPEKLREALACGATGIQVGSLFSLADESGYPAESKRKLIAQIHSGEIKVRTDGRVSSTGFPFKVVELEDTLGDPDFFKQRTRICDLGYLQQAFVDGKGQLQARCPAEPVDLYTKKGGEASATEGRGCLCNGLMANIGLAQNQKWGLEQQLFTAGDELLNLPLGSEAAPCYSAEDVLRYLRGERTPA